MKIFKLILSLALLCAFASAQKLDLATQTKGVLPGAQGGRGDTSNGVFGQVLIGDGAGHFAPGDPIVSFNYANLLTTQLATGTVIGAATRLSTFGAFGTLYVTFASITGSGTSCTVQLKNYDSLGNAINNGAAISVTPANGTTTSAVSPSLALQTAAQMSATYACSAYPTGGTITVDFVPAISVGIAGTVNAAISNFPASFSVSNFPATQPISAVALPLPTGAATAANQPALVSGRTPVDPSGVTSPISAASLPLPTGAAQDATLTGGTTKAINRGGAKGSTTAADVTSTASGANHQALDVAQYDASGNQLGLSATPVRTDPTGTTPQPVSGTVTANAGSGTMAVSAASLPLPSGAAQDATLTGGTTKAINRGGAKGSTTAADVTSTASGANHQALDVAQYDASGNQLGLSASPVRTDPTGTTTQPVSGTVSLTSGQQVKPSDGTNVITVKAASTQAAATDTSEVVQLNPNQPQFTTPLNVQGAKTNNNAAPGATNLGTLPAIANAAPPGWTEGNQVHQSQDLGGNTRVYSHPPAVLGCYQVNGRTATYGGLSAAAPLFSFRWGDATRIAIINHVKVQVIATVAATTAGQAERELIIARGFSASDTGGTAVTLTGNNQKMRTSQGTSLVTDMRFFGGTISAGTRTLDANPIASAVAWLPLNMTGVDIGCSGAGPTGAAWSCVSSSGYIDLLNTANGQDYPLVLAQNEGFIVRIGKDAMPAGATQQTYLTVQWCEANAY
ncbi:MAG TPA: hypothetical protein VGQ12_11215 [Candidatus Angelobacter sp.]|jgi:hypothetical protein|nr:hypothetical protein [Candidatus Angelobacter sp.]